MISNQQKVKLLFGIIVNRDTAKWILGMSVISYNKMNSKK